MVEFKDLAVKLVVIEELVEQGVLETPHDSGHSWLQEARNIDHSAADELIHGEYFAKRIPEIEQWARELEITEEQLAAVENLLWDGGNEIFMLMSPSWDGEDELYDPETWVDITSARFPNLKSLTYMGELEPEVLEDLEGAGVEVEEF